MSTTACTLSTKASVSSECSAATSSPVLGPTGKRLDYITWHQHHMYMAQMLGEMSTDQEKNGCYIVDQEHYQIASGYAGEIKTTNDLCQCAIASTFHKLEKKASSGENFIMYVTSLPDCEHCLKRIPKMKVLKIWYWTSSDSAINPVSTSALEGIQCEKYQPTRTISIDFHE